MFTSNKNMKNFVIKKEKRHNMQNILIMRKDVLYMKKTKILVPLDGTERSMHSLNWLKKFFNKDDIEIILMNVREIVLTEDIVISNQCEFLANESELVLADAIKELEGYKCETFSTLGYSADEILKKAKEDRCDMIIMTKSTKKGLPRMIGSVSSKVIKHAETAVVVLPQ